MLSELDVDVNEGSLMELQGHIGRFQVTDLCLEMVILRCCPLDQSCPFRCFLGPLMTRNTCVSQLLDVPRITSTSYCRWRFSSLALPFFQCFLEHTTVFTGFYINVQCFVIVTKCCWWVSYEQLLVFAVWPWLTWDSLCGRGWPWTCSSPHPFASSWVYKAGLLFLWRFVFLQLTADPTLLLWGRLFEAVLNCWSSCLHLLSALPF